MMRQAVFAAGGQARYAGEHQIKAIYKDGRIKCDHYVILDWPESAQVLWNFKWKKKTSISDKLLLGATNKIKFTF